MSIPILMYHEVESRGVASKRYTITTDQFETQLGYLRDNRIQALVLDRQLDRQNIPSAPSAIITFDDSHLCHYTVSYPLLQQYRIRATFFVVTSFLDQDTSWLTRVQLKAMHAGGMAIQSHTHTHRFLDTLTYKDLHDELKTSKLVLEDCLGESISVLSCPGGRYNRRVIDVASEVGYHAVCTSVPGLASMFQASNTAAILPRFLITTNTGIGEFRRMVSADPLYSWRKRGSYYAKYLAKRALGNDAYQRLWEALAKRGS
jgi:peptidoglycan/xylan/chitin deacetylase (PgdA/CDA1 family)